MPELVPKGPGGQPTKLTPDLQSKLINALKLGMYIRQACEFVGISAFTYHHWLKQAAKGRKLYVEFKVAADNAAAVAEGSALQTVRAAGDNWQANAWFLERRFRDRWARTRDNSGVAETPVQKQLVVRFAKPGEVKPEPDTEGK